MSNLRREKQMELENQGTQFKDEINYLKEKHKAEFEDAKNEISQLNNWMKKTQKKLKEKNDYSIILEQRYKKVNLERKKLLDESIDAKGRIRVYWRLRPLSSKELATKELQAVKAVDESTIRFENNGKECINTYDSVFNFDTSQEYVFEDTKKLIQHAFDGYNVCIFAYGATGSGKTYTIQGTYEKPGICPRALAEIFRIREEVMNQEYSIKVQWWMIELYWNKINDLIYLTNQVKAGKKPQNIINPNQLKIRDDEQGIAYVENCIITELEDEKSAIELYSEWIENRKCASTNYNEHSSRSHLIFSIILEIQNNKTKNYTFSKISLIDLAGSENLKNEDNKVRKEEGIYVNKSLSALRNVISELTKSNDKPQHIPYRNSHLTLLMRDSLGGNSKTLVIWNISPTLSWFDQTKQSLFWASTLKSVKNHAIKNKESEEVSQLKEEKKNLLGNFNFKNILRFN